MDKRSGRAVVCCGLLALIIAGILFRSMQLCDGHFGYPIDDTYIHMAMAKNLALHGVWGVTRHEFSSSTSSPLFTFLLAAAYYGGGVREITPLFLNAVLACALIWWCCYVLERAALSSTEIVGGAALLILAIPLHALTLVGMEHVLHTLLSLLFLHVAAQMLAGSTERRFATALLALTPFLVLARYEGTFLVLAAGILFLQRRRWGMFSGLGLLSALPLAAYAAVSMRRGWSAFPNSLLLKANLPKEDQGDLREFFVSLGRNFSAAPHLPLLLLLAAGLLTVSWRKHRTIWTYPGLSLTMFLAAGTLHLLFARVGWYFRYEAYLVALGGIASLVAAADLRGDFRNLLVGRWRWTAAAVAVMLFAALTVRSARSIYLTPRGIRNIYDQQYQTARFIRQFYGAAAVVVNDIGAVCFLSDARLLDPIGLGNMESAAARFQGRYSSRWLGKWAERNRAAIAIVYLDVQPPADWTLMGTWTIPDRWVVGHAEVNVYAIDLASAPIMRSRLRRFQAELPRGVRWMEK